jgi:hypothetical protein
MMTYAAWEKIFNSHTDHEAINKVEDAIIKEK